MLELRRASHVSILELTGSSCTLVAGMMCACLLYSFPWNMMQASSEENRTGGTSISQRQETKLTYN